MVVFRILGLVLLHCLNNRNADDLMYQSVKAISCSSCPLYHVKSFVAFFPLLYLGIKVYGQLKFTGTPAQYYSMHFCFIIFASSYSLLIFLIPTPLPWQVVFLSRLVPSLQCCLPSTTLLAATWDRDVHTNGQALPSYHQAEAEPRGLPPFTEDTKASAR